MYCIAEYIEDKEETHYLYTSGTGTKTDKTIFGCTLPLRTEKSLL
jgi:hypothetical protein